MNTIRNIHLLQPFQKTYQTLPSINLKHSQINQLILVLDIDETMIHVLDHKDSSLIRFQYEIDIPHAKIQNQKVKIRLNVRSHLFESLHELRDNFTLISFTASEQSYADSILDFLEDLYCKWLVLKFKIKNNKSKLFKQRLYR